MLVNQVMKPIAAATFYTILICPDAFAADHKVWMQGTGGQVMQFEPEFLKIAVGDTVTFMPEAAGHSVKSIAGPSGSEPWVGRLDHELTVTFSSHNARAAAATCRQSDPQQPPTMRRFGSTRPSSV